MKAPKLGSLCLTLLLLLPSLAEAAEPAPPVSGFSGLWTGWSRVNREAMGTETDAMRRLRQDIAAADAERLRQLQNQGRELGERVGEIVRLGDCADGERVARAAGDFALVEAVRAHCARIEPSAAQDR